jgi:hypothetical protein
MISILHEKTRNEYYNNIRTLFNSYIINFTQNKKINIDRIFGCFLSTLYFFDTKIKDDVICLINDNQALITIKNNLLYNKIDVDIINNELTVLFINNWNNLSKNYLKKLKKINIEYEKIDYINNKLSNIYIHPKIYDKLNKLFINKVDKNIINNYIYILVYRYSYFGMYDNNGQLALNEKQKLLYKEKYNIDTELFASSINHYYKNYYSLFPKLEYYFGSLGRFNLKTKLGNKYYFSNPPFEEEIMYQTSLIYINCMKKYNSKFITTIPIWNKIEFNKSNKPEIYKDYMALYTIIPYIKSITKYSKNELEYFNYTTQKSVYVSDTYIIFLSNIIQ